MPKGIGYPPGSLKKSLDGMRKKIRGFASKKTKSRLRKIRRSMGKAGSIGRRSARMAMAKASL